ncbi:NADH-cytochrome b5 reductase-like protein isoform X1 [Gossypium australe]|uniref:NADH-cytochrome b5 reductase-like protein isoform X1 n=1 Tax=Gossypium australe TaxID=47621 RepID=A0A5B6VH61_9ROSI|nr:NADH-cytochrome b5 reductase-like protein isoform X1 [Gossypium australe]
MPRSSASVKRQVYHSILSDKKAVLDIPTCKKLAKSTSASFNTAFVGKPKSGSAVFSFSAITAMAGGFSTYYYISESESNLGHPDQINEETGPKVALKSDKWLEFKLQDTARVSHNSQLFRAPLGQNAEGKTKYVIRPYTPISDPTSSPLCPRICSQFQRCLSRRENEPIEKLRYSPYMKKHIGMIAGGAGITPMLQVFYIVDNPTKKWKGGTGYISKDMVTKGLPGPSDDTLIFVSGPPGMLEHICGGKAKDHSRGQLDGILKELGYTEQMVYKF